jgi:uncharacterized membrane protein
MRASIQHLLIPIPMLGRFTWILPAAFLALAVVYAVGGHHHISALYAVLGVGLALHALGVERGVGPMQWFGAAIAAFATVILLWLAFGTQ